MAYRRFLTQKELVEAMEEIVLEQEEGYIDGVYIPPDPDVLTDEETFDDEANLCEVGEPKNIAGTFELQGPSGKDFQAEAERVGSDKRSEKDLPTSPGTSNSPHFKQNLDDDSSDDETLASIAVPKEQNGKKVRSATHTLQPQ
ncbi:uncharacterized protein LOC126742204 [Anthonomus grandis grandis]|uniref:uncharacterized protein LOC126742204 n=1 Tax=Anthonomus grandis grandis TaxID=2921223 RepID=UPI002165EFAE|nr:uncharacterized protein LOC126742204 [Anthonomus grandis grandis]